MIENLERKFWRLLNAVSPRTHSVLFEKRLVLVFLVAGGAALVADVATLYVAKGVFGIRLIPAVAIAFFAGFCTSFLLQKFWTFKDRSVDRVHKQAGLYFIVTVICFFLTEVLMHFLVEYLGAQYLFAKIVVAGAIACGTFFIYKLFIFKQAD